MGTKQRSRLTPQLIGPHATLPDVATWNDRSNPTKEAFIAFGRTHDFHGEASRERSKRRNNMVYVLICDPE